MSKTRMQRPVMVPSEPFRGWLEHKIRGAGGMATLARELKVHEGYLCQVYGRAQEEDEISTATVRRYLQKADERAELGVLYPDLAPIPEPKAENERRPFVPLEEVPIRKISDERMAEELASCLEEMGQRIDPAGRMHGLLESFRQALSSREAVA